MEGRRENSRLVKPRLDSERRGEERDANQIFCRWSYNRRNEQRLRDFLSPLAEEQKNEGIGEITAFSSDILGQPRPCQCTWHIWLILFNFIWFTFSIIRMLIIRMLHISYGSFVNQNTRQCRHMVDFTYWDTLQTWTQLLLSQMRSVVDLLSFFPPLFRLTPNWGRRKPIPSPLLESATQWIAWLTPDLG